MQLPDFVEDKAKFEGTITIRHRGEPQETILEVSHGKKELSIKPIQYNPAYFKLVNKNMTRKQKIEIYDYYQVESKDLGEVVNNWYAMQQVIDINAKNSVDSVTTAELKEPNIGLFMINQLLGRVTGQFEVICTVQYWPTGKVDEQGKKVFPYLLSYQYTADTSHKPKQ
ncbi:hypothetical protein GAPWKB11_1297 [Gilliamella apicola]|nr:hypothetical protein GAPWKB11_1297 [Gilliamella apicola]